MIIAVCGNGASGKSTLSIKIATELAKRKLNTILIDTDFITPQFNIWYPSQEIFNHSSLAVLLDNNIDVEAVTDKIHVINENLGVLGYARDYSANAMPRRPDTTTQLLASLNEIADYIVVDVQTGFINDILSFEVMSTADTRIIAISPDLKGLSWYDSNIKMMEEAWKNSDAHTIKVFNKTYTQAPLTEIEQIIGDVAYYLPLSNEIEEQMHTGTMDDLSPNQSSAKKYTSIVQSIVNEILETQDNK